MLLCIGHISKNGKVSFSYWCIVVRYLYTVKRHCCGWYNKKLHGQYRQERQAEHPGREKKITQAHRTMEMKNELETQNRREVKAIW